VAPVDATLAALTADPARTVLMLDYDGSLSPIVAHPEEAAPLPGTAGVLDAIAARLALVAIVSGRPLDFLRHALHTRHVALVGQYGLEWVQDGQVVVDERALPYVDAVAAAGDELERRWPDLYIERKGAVAVTAHWRMAPETGDAVVREIDALARRLGLEVHPSRKARELRPPLGVDKGAAVQRLLARVPNVSAAAFAGDDAGDLPAFAALERLRADGRLERVARIAVSSPEAPEAVLAGGDVVVDGPKGLRELLDALASRLGEQVP
jgi:trehalose 6-phosphate phosphatase